VLVNRPYFSPWLNGHYILSPFSKLVLNSGLNTNIGDITDFIINPIQSSYNQKSSKSGILAITRSYSTNLRFEFKNPLELFFANASFNYGNADRNILNNQSIISGTSNVDINNANIADKNKTQSTSASGSMSKTISDISTTFSLDANYGISSSVQLRQGVKSNVYGNSFSVSPTIRSTLIKKLEMNYSMNYGQSWQHSVNFKSVFHSQSHNMTINYNPIEAIIVYGSVEYNRFEIMPKQFKNMQFFNAGVRYKYKKLKAELKLNNLLNTKVYNYTVLDQMDRFTYTYHLNQREVVVIFKFTV
jgi:hypothetical protein